MWLVVAAILLGALLIAPVEEWKRHMRIEAVRNPKPKRTPWLCRHGVHAWPSPAYDEAVCMRCGKPYLEP